MINKWNIILICSGMFFASCVKHEANFKARSEIKTDGSFYRSGEMKIGISGERNVEEDSLNIWGFYTDSYVMPDENRFSVSHTFGDSSLTVYWDGTIAPQSEPLGDYIHKSKEGPAAINNISVQIKSRWIYKDITYVETFSDPVDTATYFPLIETRLSGASDYVLNHDALKGIRDKEEAGKLLDNLESEAGLDLLRGILKNPAGFDSLSAVYDSRITTLADSLAGFAGVKQNPDSLGNLIHNVFDAAWDTLLSDHPGLFGSFSIDDIDVHNFRVEVEMPGCLLNSNADSTFNGVALWEFNRLDFFAREYTIEIAARQWRWVNVAITIIVLALILFAVLRPIRKGKTA